MGALIQSLWCLNLVFYFWGCPTLAWLHKNEIRKSFTLPQMHVFHHCQVLVRWNCISKTIQGMLKIFVLRKCINWFSGAFQNSNPKFHNLMIIHFSLKFIYSNWWQIYWKYPLNKVYREPDLHYLVPQEFLLPWLPTVRQMGPNFWHHCNAFTSNIAHLLIYHYPYYDCCWTHRAPASLVSTGSSFPNIFPPQKTEKLHTATLEFNNVPISQSKRQKKLFRASRLRAKVQFGLKVSPTERHPAGTQGIKTFSFTPAALVQTYKIFKNGFCCPGSSVK